MVSKAPVLKRLQKLEEYIRLLERLKEYSKTSVLEDPFVYGNIERYLQLAIQTVIDVGNHILAERKVRGVEEYRNIIEVLGKEGVIPSELAEKIAPMAGLRNILVHDYLEVDREKLYEVLQHRLTDLKDFGKHISKIIQ